MSWLQALVLRTAHELALARLRLEALLAFGRGDQPAPRVVVTACWSFPIYSQTFVQREVMALARAGFAVRFMYARLGRKNELDHACQPLWALKRRVFLHAHTGAADLARFRRCQPAVVEQLIADIAAASGLSRQQVEAHEHFLHACSFARAAKAWRADYLHSYFFYEQSLFALVTARLLDIPRGISCYADHMLDDYALKLVPLHLRSASIMLATSRRIKVELEAIHGSPLASIVIKVNAVDATSFSVARQRRRQAADGLSLLCVSRIDAKKGIEYLIDSVYQLRLGGFAVEARIVGAADANPAASEYERGLRALVRQLGLTSCVHFIGQCDSRAIAAELARTDVFVAPYVDLPNGDKDGIPTALLEAMAAGCAIVATNAGSISEIIDDGIEGVLVPQRDSGAVAAAVLGLANDRQRAEDLGSRAAERARREFDVAACEHVFHARVHAAVAGQRRAPRGQPSA